MASKIKVDNINKVSDDSNIIKKCGTTTTIGSGASNPIVVDGSAVTIGRCGGTVSLASGATQTGFGRSGSVNWSTTPKTSTFTAVSGNGYFVNSGSALTMNLPAGTAGDIVAVSDYARNFATYNLTISPNGSEKIGGEANDLKAIVDGQALTLVYVDSTKGWVNVQNAQDTQTGAPPYIIATGGTITTSGDYKIHTFTGPGTFTVCKASGICAATRNLVSYLVVAGGGTGGSHYGGGGGGGGFREYRAPLSGCYAVSPLNGNPGGTAITVSAQGYPIVVGAGGTGVPAPSNCTGGAGNTSSFSTVSSAGGGGGGGQGAVGANGGSGGGGSWNPSSGAAGGTGNTPPVSPPQGKNGGQGYGPQSPYATAGGGGATEAGVNGQGSPSAAGRGGAGATTSINGPPTAYSGGGGGSGLCGGGQSATAGAASPCGTGTAGAASNTPSTAGTANRGGGTGGAFGPGPSSVSGNGGSGIVIIRYKYQ